MSVDPYAQHSTWRDTVEHRLGHLARGGDEAVRQDHAMRQELRDLEQRIDLGFARVSDQLSAQMGAIRADVLAMRVSAATEPQKPAFEMDWRAVALVSALISGGLVGIGFTMGKTMTVQTAADMAQDVITP
jgi:hypothetical protein